MPIIGMFAVLSHIQDVAMSKGQNQKEHVVHMSWRSWFKSGERALLIGVIALFCFVFVALAFYLSGWVAGTVWEVTRWTFSTMVWIFWDGLFAHTVGMPIWWLSNYTGATPLSPLMIFLIYGLYCINCLSDEESFGARIILSYVLIFSVGLYFRLG